MSMNIKVVNWLSLLTTVMVVALSVSSFFIYSISSWTLISLVGLIMLLGLSFFSLWQRPYSFFAWLATMFSLLVVGRLFSTMRLSALSETGSALDPLLLAETGPGLPWVTWSCVGLFVLLMLKLWSIIQHDRSVAGTSSEQWGMTAIRVYVGLMFIAHFAGHLFAGPQAFEVFRNYFASIGLPYPAYFVVLAGLIELAVAFGLAFGFLTRLAAFGGAVYLLVSVGMGGHYGVGYIWVLPTGGWEFPALWAFVVGVFAFTGAGPVSVDNYLRTPRY
ncbi:MAG: DoxX family protein [Pseudomonas sp.]|nr:DoxX family protein [Pseudomonas sp.]